MRRTRTALGLLICTGALAAAFLVGLEHARAEGIPAQNPLFYTGQLSNNGTPVTGKHLIEVNLWKDPTSTATADRACATVPVGNTPVDQGHFRIALDPTCVQAIHQDPDLYAEVVVDGTALPRTKLGAVPYAVEAASAVQATGPGSVQYWSAHRTGFLPPSTGPFTTIPGLSMKLDLRRAATLRFSANGTQEATGQSNYCDVEYRFVIDGTPLGDPVHGQRILENVGSDIWKMWSMADSATLSPGSHTVEVQAHDRSQGCIVCGEAVGGGSTPDYSDCVIEATAFYQ